MNAVDQVAVAAFEERRQFIGRSAGTLFFGAVDENVRDLFDRGTAKGMPENVDLLVGSFLAEILKDTGVHPAVAGMVIFFAVDFSVVDTAAEQVGPKDAGSVPAGVPGPERRVEHFETLLFEVRDEVPGSKKVPIRELAFCIDRIVFAPAVPAGNQHKRIIVVILAHWTHLQSFSNFII